LPDETSTPATFPSASATAPHSKPWRFFKLTLPDFATDAAFILVKAKKGRGGGVDLDVQHADVPNVVRSGRVGIDNDCSGVIDG
jgi:hypothetical protein